MVTKLQKYIIIPFNMVAIKPTILLKFSKYYTNGKAVLSKYTLEGNEEQNTSFVKIRLQTDDKVSRYLKPHSKCSIE